MLSFNVTQYDTYDVVFPGDLYKEIPIEIPYSDLTITVTNIDTTGKDFHGWVDYYEAGYSYPNIWATPIYLLSGGSQTFPVDLSTYGGTPPYHLGVNPNEGLGIQNTALVSVDVTKTNP